jgi:hypothetical protein
MSKHQPDSRIGTGYESLGRHSRSNCRGIVVMRGWALTRREGRNKDGDVSRDDIDWAALRACYGPATEIPVLITQLANPNPAERNEAIARLWGCLCHQGTVYEASAAAVPLLFRAARSLDLPSEEREQLLALIVHIGLGEDTTWQGYTLWETVQECSAAISAVLPAMYQWAMTGDSDAKRWALVLAAYNPDAWAALGADEAQLLQTTNSTTRRLAAATVQGADPDPGVIQALVSADPDLLDYYEHVLVDLPLQRQARRLMVELAIARSL